MGTKINAEIYGNLPYGIIRLSKKGFSTVVYRVPRSQLDYFYESIEESHHYGTYILFNKVTRQAYVGRTEDLQKRSKQHNTKKPFWTEMFAITTKNKDEFELTDIAFLEHTFYEMAIEAKSYAIENNTVPSDGNAIDNMPEILEFTRNCLNILGYDLFEKAHDLTEYSLVEVTTTSERTVSASTDVGQKEPKEKVYPTMPGYMPKGKNFPRIIDNKKKKAGELFFDILHNLSETGYVFDDIYFDECLKDIKWCRKKFGVGKFLLEKTPDLKDSDFYNENDTEQKTPRYRRAELVFGARSFYVTTQVYDKNKKRIKAWYEELIKDSKAV